MQLGKYAISMLGNVFFRNHRNMLCTYTQCHGIVCMLTRARVQYLIFFFLIKSYFALKTLKITP